MIETNTYYYNQLNGMIYVLASDGRMRFFDKSGEVLEGGLPEEYEKVLVSFASEFGEQNGALYRNRINGMLYRLEDDGVVAYKDERYEGDWVRTIPLEAYGDDMEKIT